MDNFVRYSPDVEQLDPDFDRTVATVLDNLHRQSSILRHKLNNQARREPRNLAEIFGS